MEKWRTVKIDNKKTQYLISDSGQLYDTIKQKLCQLSTKWVTAGRKNKRYFVYDFKINGTYKQYMIHRIVAQTFIKNPKKLETVDHINNISTDNRVENLQWLSREDNTRKSTSKRVHLWRWDKETKKKIEYLGIYSSIISACIKFNINYSRVYKQLQGEKEHVNGYVFEEVV
jgi:hypothetical protein